MHWTYCLESGGPKQCHHATAVVGNIIYTFGDTWNKGGRSPKSNIEVHCFDTDTMEWFEVEYDETIECPRNCRRLSVVTYQNFIFLWGGIDDYLEANSLFSFDSTTLTWSKPAVSGNVPSPRSCHSACVIGPYMYVFGGYDNLSSSYLNTVFRLNLTSFEWEEVLTSGIPPEERRFHSACAIDDRMFIFGGMGFDLADYQRIALDDLSCLDTFSMCWMTPKYSGKTPCKRFNHTGVVCNNEMYIIGGEMSYNKRMMNELDDVWKFNPYTFVWTQITAKGRRPCPRSQHSCAAVGDRLFVLGGRSKRGNHHRNFDNYIVHADVHVLDLSPNLQVLCSIKINDRKIDTSKLPKDIQKVIKAVDDSPCHGWKGMIERGCSKKKQIKNRTSFPYRLFPGWRDSREDTIDWNRSLFLFAD